MSENGNSIGSATEKPEGSLQTDPTEKKSTLKPGSTETNRTIVMQTSRKVPLNRSKKSKVLRSNFSAKFSLEALRKKNPNSTQKKEIINDYFGRNLTRFTNMPIDSSPAGSAEVMPQLENRYEDLDVVNEGGQGVISAAKENILGRIVALKTLRTTEKVPNNGVNDFISEAKVTAQLDHPSIIPIYALGQNKEGNLQLAMKLVNGKTLREHLKNINLNYRMQGIDTFDERTSLYKRLEILLHVCDALIYAHHRNIMHCDLKPENIMIGEYMEVYLMDWGLAKPIPKHDDDSEWVRPDTIAGTPRYLSPEAVVGDRFDERADIFAMGLILQEVVTLQYAVTGEDSTEVMNKIKNGQLNPPVHQFGYAIDRDLTAIIRKATAYNREDRYQSIRELGEDLRCYMQGNEVSANPDNRFMKMVRWMTRHQTAMLVIIFFALAIALGAVTFSIYQNLEHTRLISERSDMINRAYTKCFAATSRLDREILTQEKNLTLLASLAARALSSWTVQDEKGLFRLYDKDNKLLMPDDAVFSRGYATSVSFSEGMCKAGPGQSKEDIQIKIQQLSPLVIHMQDTILSSGAELIFFSDSKRERLKRALQEGPTVKSIYIGLQNGMLLGYPCRNIYENISDPRKRPWFRRGQPSNRPVWGIPYVGSDYQLGLCLPCSVRIQDEKGKFYGVAGLDITFNKMASLLHASGNTGYHVLESTLIDSRGRIIVSSRKGNIGKQLDLASEVKKNSEISMEYFSVPKIRRRIIKQKFGILFDYEPERGEVIYLFAQMKTLNWFYVQKIDFQAYHNYYRRNQLMQKMDQQL